MFQYAHEFALATCIKATHLMKEAILPTERVTLTLLLCCHFPPPLHNASVQQLSNKKMEINWLIFETYVMLLHGMLQVVDALQ